MKAPAPLRVQFDYARHRRVMNFDRNYVRLNEFPEWFVVDDNARYDVTGPGGETLQRLGAELIRDHAVAGDGRLAERATREPRRGQSWRRAAAE